jgi:tyrosine-protein phosphatase YwqE
MWPFSTQRSLEEAGILRGWTDWHSHILPGVDDGIRTQEQSLKVLAFYAEAGVTDVWLTPHVMEDIPNTPAALKERFSVLKSA